MPPRRIGPPRYSGGYGIGLQARAGDPQQTPLLDQLASELQLQPDELRDLLLAADAETFTPNYITVNADGTISADFTGQVQALGGLTLAEGTGAEVAQPHPTPALIEWLDVLGNAQSLIGSGHSVGSNAAALSLERRHPGLGYTTEIAALIYDATGTLERRRVIDQTGRSNFAQLATARELAVYIGSAAANLAGGDQIVGVNWVDPFPAGVGYAHFYTFVGALDPNARTTAKSVTAVSGNGVNVLVNASAASNGVGVFALGIGIN